MTNNRAGRPTRGNVWRLGAALLFVLAAAPAALAFELAAAPAALAFELAAAPAAAGDIDGVYYPDPGDGWRQKSPADAGFNGPRLAAAIAFARDNETKYPPELAAVADVRDLRQKLRFDWTREPYNRILGPTKPRAPLNGLILRHGFIVAEWGQTRRVDMTFSVSKTFLSSVAGVAFDRGLIGDIDDPVGDSVTADYYQGAHNAAITWNHMLRQTSGWEGTLWGKPAWADRPGNQPWSELIRKPEAPGARWKYNDVRVNMLALSLLHLFRRPLPEVLRENIMEPIGASRTWHWEGYENSWVTIDGVSMQSVSGGGHWGGGMFISARDLARLGYLGLRRGRWGDRQVLSEAWVRMATTPTKANKKYGFMNWFLNTDRELMPSAPESALYFAGSGANIVYVDPPHDIVAVVRWIDRRAIDGFIKRLIGALAGAPDGGQ